jgi:cation:H+ antiporter
MVTLLMVLAGLALLVAGAELLVRGASALARAFGMPSLIIGLTVVAYGTSAPEFAVSLKASLAGQPDIALGNVIGSNTFNVLFILGISAVIAPLAVSSQLVRLDVPVMIGVSGLTWLMASNGMIGRVEGVALLAGIVVYTALLIWLGKRQGNALALAEPEAPRREPVSGRRLVVPALLVVAGLVLLVLGAGWLVEGAVKLARVLGVSELLIGLTIIAAGTSLPELATSVVASIRGERDIAVGNIVGSNIFNILAVLGAAAAAGPAGVAVSPAALRFDVPVMLAVALVCLPVFFTGGRISRWEGVLLLGYYAAYVAYLVLGASSHESLGAFSAAMVFFVLPGTVLGIAVSVFGAVRARRKGRDLPTR